MFGRNKIKNDYGINIDEKSVGKIVDFTFLAPTATKRDLEKFMCVASKNKYACVCVNPINVEFCKTFVNYKFKTGLKIASVVGFPLGESSVETKVFEAKHALKQGADEIDVVIAISRVKEGDYLYLRQELLKLRRVCRKSVLKVCIETALLSKQEIEKVSMLCVKCRVDYIMTSTGFAGGGATPEIVEIIRNVVKNKCGIKACGGVETKVQAVNLLRVGATRIGTSREI